METCSDICSSEISMTQKLREEFWQKKMKWSEWWQWLRKQIPSRIVSKLYKSLQKQSGSNTLHIKMKWESELNIELSESDWQSICTTQNTSTSSRGLGGFKWKNLIHFFTTPYIKNKNKANNSFLETVWQSECQSLTYLLVMWQNKNILGQVPANLWRKFWAMGFPVTPSLCIWDWHWRTGCVIFSKSWHLQLKRTSQRTGWKVNPFQTGTMAVYCRRNMFHEKLTYCLRAKAEIHEQRREKCCVCIYI